MPRLTDEQYSKIISDYLSGMTQKEAGKVNGVGRDAVGKILKRFNVPIREYTGPRWSNRKHFWDFEFFRQRDPIVAYWAGFAVADGNIKKVSSNSYSFCLCIHKDDTDHIKRFCNDVGINFDEVHIRKDGSADVRLHSKELADQLYYWGIVPRKSYNFVEPQVEFELLPHFLRGWADGDGHIYRYGRGARFTVSGNPEGLNWYADKLFELGYSGETIGFQERSENCKVLYIGGRNQVEEVAQLLLVDESDLKLERKWNSTYEGKHNYVTINCKYCGNPKDIPVGTYKARGGRFCSRKCSSLWYKENK